ncbi:putative bifunctional diguanylate cyclase/phosphodiesterase [Oceanobacillus sp. CAU 1775]
MDGTYNFYVVGLSVLIAILASYSAINIAAKISYTNNKYRLFWLLAGAIVMGSGVWSMHFIGMLAFHVDMEMSYDIGLTALSMLASVGGAFIAFYVTMPAEIKWYRIAIGGMILASGIITMHYVGMEAMIMDGSIHYDLFWLVLSIVIAYVASYAALFLFIRFRNDQTASWLKGVSAIMMGIAICGMHYTGMEAAVFTHTGLVHVESSPDNFLLYGVTITIAVILFVSWLIMFLERHVLENMAYEDMITKLPNRNAMVRFFDKFNGSNEIGLLFIDLDQFKYVNDSLGHDSGDLLIKAVGERLATFESKKQQAYRIGGDEFLIITEYSDEQQTRDLATAVLNKIKEVYFIEGNELYTTASIGISIGPLVDKGKELLKSADAAMYHAKHLGKNRYAIYNETMGIKEGRRMELEKGLQFAVENGEMYLEYQTKWNTKQNDVHGFEALLRWQHPRLGLISPGEFISIAEETGAIVPITRWVIEEASSQCARWQEKGINQPISVNLSIRLFKTDNLVEEVEAILKKVNLDPSLLELEITESLVLSDVNNVFHQLESLRELGVRISLDDFGTGYSSIGLLDRIPLDTIKLDRLFTNDLETESKRAIINAIILMAKQLNLDVIAEGIENKDQVDYLTGLGCQVIQGFYYGKPMKVADAEMWMTSRA